MVWGAAAQRGVDDLVRRLAANDPGLTSLTLLRGRRFGHDVRCDRRGVTWRGLSCHCSRRT